MVPHIKALASNNGDQLINLYQLWAEQFTLLWPKLLVWILIFFLDKEKGRQRRLIRDAVGIPSFIMAPSTPLLQELWPHLKYCLKFCTPQYVKDIKPLEYVQRRVAMMVKDPEGKT